MTDTRDLVKQQFGLHAQNYVASADLARGESLDRMLKLLPFQPEWRALDVGTGGGHTALALAPRVREVIASDLTREMLAAAEAFIRGRGVTNVNFREADAGALPFDADEFDLATCRLAAHHFPDCGQFVRESARVLKPNGWLAVIDNTTPPDVRAARHINAFEKLRDPSHNWEYSVPDWEAFCVAAGLKVYTVEEYRKPLDFEKFCDRLSVPATTRLQLRVMLYQAPALVKEWLTPEFHGDVQTGPVTIYLGEILLVAQRPA